MDHLYFFGRFNFPHVGYLYVIRESLQALHPTHGITLVFSREQSTWGKSALPLQARMEMFSLAITALPEELRRQIHFSSIEYELYAEHPDTYTGYTIDTLRALQTQFPGTTGIVMGADAFIGEPGKSNGFIAWNSWQEIAKRAQLITLPRGHYPTMSAIQQATPPELSPLILDTSPSPLELQASSSAVQAGETRFLTPEVYTYATEHALLVQ